jgi:hypothetical protein
MGLKRQQIIWSKHGDIVTVAHIMLRMAARRVQQFKFEKETRR